MACSHYCILAANGAPQKSSSWISAQVGDWNSRLRDHLAHRKTMADLRTQDANSSLLHALSKLEKNQMDVLSQHENMSHMLMDAVGNTKEMDFSKQRASAKRSSVLVQSCMPRMKRAKMDGTFLRERWRSLDLQLHSKVMQLPEEVPTRGDFKQAFKALRAHPEELPAGFGLQASLHGT